MSTHLVKHQKITRRQIKEDPLVTAAFRATEVWDRQRSRILIALGAVVLVGLLVFFMMQARSKAEEKASGDLFRATLAIQQGDYASATPMLKEIVDNSPGTKSARTAMLYLGDAAEAQGHSSESVSWYRRFLDKASGNKDLERQGYNGLGAALEDAHQYGPAADAYGEAAKRSPTGNIRGRAMMAQGRALLGAGQTAKAIEVYKAVSLLPDAEQGITDAAKEKIGELQPTAATP
jgi:outer membrane protein assembly factor BamD (BamD/ComL family)